MKNKMRTKAKEALEGAQEAVLKEQIVRGASSEEMNNVLFQHHHHGDAWHGVLDGCEREQGS